MKLTVYLDMLIITNVIINYFLLKIALVLSQTAADTTRIILSALIGSLFSLIIFADINFVMSLFVKLLSVIMSVFVAFGYSNKRIFIRLNFYCLAAHLIFAGAMTLLLQSSQMVYMNNLYFYINLNPFLLVGCILTVYLVLSLADLINVKNREYSYVIHITFEKCTYSAHAYYDTGFNLKDVLTHHPVMLCSIDFFDSRTSNVTLTALRNFLTANIYDDKSIIPVFYSDISHNGMLPAIRPDKVIIEKNKKQKEIKNTILAVTDRELPEDVQIIFGKEIFNMIGD